MGEERLHMEEGVDMCQQGLPPPGFGVRMDPLTYIMVLIATAIALLQGRKTEDQGGEMICPRSHS
jgi:hypothetical protein